MGGLVAVGSLRELFKALLEDAIGRQKVQLGEGTEFYLVNLLSDFVTSERLFTEDENGRKDHEPLAVLYHTAQQGGRDERIRKLRRLGDVSLYKVGFFAESLRAGVVGPEYYIQMGGAAYGHVADLSISSGFSAVYRELCDKFRELVEVLEEIAARGLVSNGAAGALKVYEAYTRSGNDRLEKVLVDAGIVVPKVGLPN